MAQNQWSHGRQIVGKTAAGHRRIALLAMLDIITNYWCWLQMAVFLRSQQFDDFLYILARVS